MHPIRIRPAIIRLAAQKATIHPPQITITATGNDTYTPPGETNTQPFSITLTATAKYTKNTPSKLKPELGNRKTELREKKPKKTA